VPSYAGFFILGVPWYWPAHSGETLLAGVPLWAAASLGCSVAISALTAYLVLWHWPEGEEGEDDGV